MDIKNNNSINFKASGVLTVKKALKNGQETMIDVLKLNHKQDDAFIKTYYNTLNNNVENLQTSQKRLLKFFKEYLNDSKFDSQDFYIGVKDGETIVGGFNSYPIYDKVILNNCITTKKDPLSRDSFLYSLLQETKDNYSNSIVGAEMPKFFKIENMNICKENFGKLKSKIKKQNPDTEFKKYKDANINLAEFFDIKDI